MESKLKTKFNIMKKVFLVAITFIGFMVTSNAQDISENAIGIRLGDSDGFGGEVSYQRALNENNRLEFDLGWRSGKGYDGFKLTGLYQWVWNIEGGFNWYAGVGGGIGSWDNDAIDKSGIVLLAAGDIGIEYNFKEAPIQLSLDFRPEFYFNDDFRDDNFGSDIALGIRYRF